MRLSSLAVLRGNHAYAKCPLSWPNIAQGHIQTKPNAIQPSSQIFSSWLQLFIRC